MPWMVPLSWISNLLWKNWIAPDYLVLTEVLDRKILNKDF
jgi:hypothetical protein